MKLITTKESDGYVIRTESGEEILPEFCWDRKKDAEMVICQLLIFGYASVKNRLENGPFS